MLSHGDVRQANPAESPSVKLSAEIAENAEIRSRAAVRCGVSLEDGRNDYALPHYRKYRKFPPQCMPCLHTGTWG